MQQLSLISIEQAKNIGEIGMLRAADHAERVHCGWQEEAVAALLTYVQTMPRERVFIFEDIRFAVESRLPEPPDRRAWGSVAQAAIKRLYITRTGDFAPARSSNAAPKPLYRRGSTV